MKHVMSAAAIPVLLASILLTSCVGMPEEIPMENRLAVAVAGIEKAPASAASMDDTLVAELLRTKRFRVIERARLDALLRENELSLSALADSTVRPKILSVIGADAVLLTSVTEIRQYSGRTADSVTGWWSDVSLGIEAKVTARLVSVSTGEVLAAASASGRAEAGTFSGAMGLSKVEKGKDKLTDEALSDALAAAALEVARAAPGKR